MVHEIAFSGHGVLSEAELAALFEVEAGGALVLDGVEAGAAAVRAAYEERGYRGVEVEVGPELAEAAPPDGGAEPAVVPMRLLVDIAEGPATMVRAVTFEGVTAFTEAELRRLDRGSTRRPVPCAAGAGRCRGDPAGLSQRGVRGGAGGR